MKARILKKFKDKNTGRIYIPGEMVDFTEQRVEEIMEKTKLIEVQEEVAPEETIEEVQEEMKEEKAEEEVTTKKKRSKKEDQ